MVFKRPSRSLEGEKGEFNSHRKTKVFHTASLGNQPTLNYLTLFPVYSQYSMFRGRPKQ